MSAPEEGRLRYLCSLQGCCRLCRHFSRVRGWRHQRRSGLDGAGRQAGWTLIRAASRN